MQIKAVYKNKVLNPLEKLNLEEGETVEIELRRKEKIKRDILKYAGMLRLSEKEERIFREAVRRRELFS